MNVRPAARDDYPAFASLFELADEAVLGYRVPIDVSEVDAWLHGVALDTNTWLFEQDGQLVAAAFAHLLDDKGIFAGSVHPDFTGQGLGTRIVELAEKRLVAEGARRLHAWTVAGNDRGADLFRGCGYSDVRRFWDMEILLDAEPPAPAVEVEQFRLEEAEAFHAGIEEAFRDHWEHEDEPFEKWWERQQGRSNFDPSLWFVIRDGDEIAALCRNEERESGGYIGALGVRRPWRGRGLGRALLLHGFREFRRRGHTRATLGVDAENPTGATRLYESVGMHVLREDVVWEKIVSA
jgi:mycothiol synthase